MKELQEANALIKAYEDTFTKPKKAVKGKKLYTGVDLGTAYIVLAVVDQDGTPVAGAMEFAEVVKDGLVVDYNGAMQIVKKLKHQIEEAIDRELETAGVAYPPGTNPSDCRAIRYVAEACGFQVEYTMDEPTAANNVLNIEDGAVVDIGGGTTGIAVLKKGEVISVDDEPSGGTHLSLVIAGAKGIEFLEAEELKKDKAEHKELMPLVRPVFEKMGSIIGNSVKGHKVDTIYLVGGTCCFEGVEKVLEKQLKIRVVKPDNPMLVTPLGIALGSMKQGQQEDNGYNEDYDY
ncbi:MAG: ethanolamine utilization protein EutJ [Bacillota bacterium]|nr:ethanolamine utilization protein EutJ [Bacillota bacterium]